VSAQMTQSSLAAPKSDNTRRAARSTSRTQPVFAPAQIANSSSVAKPLLVSQSATSAHASALLSLVRSATTAAIGAESLLYHL
jgi:hypothetical protein